MADQPHPLPFPSRRSIVIGGSTLLAGFGTPTSTNEPAAYRPVQVSSTAYAPTPSDFAVDGIAAPGVQGTGWRAGAGDLQWISVDLQAACQVTWIRLAFEADASDPVFVPPASGNWADGTTGKEILSSYAVEFVVETSLDHSAWTSVYRTTAGTGGVVNIQLPRPVSARWVRMTAHRLGNSNPLGLNGFEVYGTARRARTPVGVLALCGH